MSARAARPPRRIDPERLRPEFRDPLFWEKNTARFLAFARSCIARRPFRGSYARGPADAEAHDYVTRATMLIFDGTRRCPDDLESVPYVLGVIRSLISHSGETPENRAAHAFIDDSEGVFDERQIAARQSRAAIDEELEAKELAEKFLQAAPEQYRDYLRILMSGLYPTAEDRARAMGVTVARIRQLDKNVRRLRSRWKGSEPPPKKRRK